MRLLLTALLCTLLCGCAGEAPQPTTPAESLPVLSEIFTASYDCPLIPLSQESIRDLKETPVGPLVVSGHDSTTLTLLSPSLSPAWETTLPFDTDPIPFQTGIACLDIGTRELHLLDSSLQESACLPLPDGQTGPVLLSQTGNIVYYTTDRAIYAWELDSGIRRRIKILSDTDTALTALLLEDTILQCTAGGRTLFLNAETGALVEEFPEMIQLQTLEKDFYAGFTLGFVPSLVWSQGEDTLTLVSEENIRSGFFLPRQDAVVTLSDEGILTCYRLSTGQKLDTLTPDAPHQVRAVLGSDRDILVLLYDPEGDASFLLRWQLPREASGPSHSEAYAPDDGLAQCRKLAEALSVRYGIPIQIGKAATSSQPWDYTLEPETRTPLIRQQLESLSHCLSQYPSQVLALTAGNFDSLTISLVRSISGQESGLSTATGIQFLQGRDAHVVIAAGQYAEQSFYHEFFHAMETHIFSGSNALDQWADLNPAGFSYDLDHAANQSRNSGVYLENGTRAFVDTYSMSFPREDRARIFEYAMLPGQEALFRSDIMQQKLKTICTGIREAYGLEQSPEAFPWEQYLQ